MFTSKKYWIVSLSVVLCFSLVLPLCAHAEMQRMTTHQNHGQEHAAHNHDVDCTCGHQLAEAFQKVEKKPLNKLNLSIALVFTDGISLPADPFALSKSFNLPAVFDDTGPPIHLLNCVFLN